MSGALAKVPSEGMVSRKYSLANLLEKTETALGPALCQSLMLFSTCARFSSKA